MYAPLSVCVYACVRVYNTPSDFVRGGAEMSDTVGTDGAREEPPPVAKRLGIRCARDERRG